MVRVEVLLSDDNFDRLLAIKNLQAGKTDLTAAEYARELLEAAIYRMHPAKAETDPDTGDIIK